MEKQDYNDLFEPYLQSKYMEMEYINTMATTNNKKKLKEIYIPSRLKIQKDRINENKKKIVNDEITVNGFPTQFDEEKKCNLIIDTAGMGKSTLSKRIFIDLVETERYIPIFVELRRLTRVKKIEDEIFSMLNVGKDVGLVNNTRKLFQGGGFVFLLDGYDEISLDSRQDVDLDIVNFVDLYKGGNVFVMTSRPEDMPMYFSNFMRYKIEPLSRDESFKLLTNHDNGGAISQLLITKLKSGNYRVIDEFLTNPLLVSLLYAAFDFKQAIPLKKHLFYQQVYDAYFEKHDLTKGDGYSHQKKTKLDSYDFDRILRSIGYKSLQKQKIEYSLNELISVIDMAKKDNPSLNFRSMDFRDDLLEAVPLFCKESVYFKWVHKSMQEYFAARFIYMDAKSNQDKLLSTMFNSEKLEYYYNIFDIYYDIDNYSFKKNVILPFLREYDSYYVANYHPIEGIPDKLIDERISLLFGKSVCVAFYPQKVTPDDDFDLLFKKCLSIGFKINRATSININEKGRFIVGFERYMPKRMLMTLLFTRMPKLFKIEKLDKTSLSRSVKTFEFFKLSGVDDFSYSKDAYAFCNYALGRSHGELYVLDIYQVREEIAQIEYSIRNREKIGELIDGL